MYGFIDLQQYKLPILFLVLGSVCILVSLIAISKAPTANEPENFIIATLEEPIENAMSETFVIDIQGAVKEPGVYEFDDNTRIGQVIEQIGGFHDDADISWIGRELNQALEITDGMKIYIPFEGEEGHKLDAVVSSTSPHLIDLNSSTQTELETLPGIGEVTAKKIINSRPLTSVEELVETRIIGEKTYHKIKNSVVVGSL